MNLFVFTGNLGQDCERKALVSGTSVCSFSVAVKSGYGDKEKTTWVKCSMFGKKAEGKLPDYLTKGAKVAITGELSLDEWKDKQGATKSTLSVAVSTIDLIGSRPANDAQQAQNAPQNAGFDDFGDESIPF
jgi:single-strand DNA-binding protein